MNSLVTYWPPRPTTELDAAFADFLRVDVANGDAAEDTVRNYRAEVERWIAWCVQRGTDPVTATTAEIKQLPAGLD